MNVTELVKDYEKQADLIQRKIDELSPLLSVYKGEDLYLLRKKIKIYDDMLCECRRTAVILKGYCNE